ncbi:hypothetical protein SEA_WHEEHEIM_33 [Streptomyces phage WheeHeim]|uniref:Uncharacterized protein n=1 Tax=Streptomyces phage WheeHeim TaxID=2500797 RepID=A0A411AXX4_9VIRU|nr:hypothetical protein KMD61_gp12 [Streptomyces phage WheeHeim]QAX92941.1 hypothetical protein SEA_WHEEHEIM_33 [Streptomyces phage WheeHeim]
MGVNPFVGGSYRQRKGQQTPIDRPDRVKPVPDEIEGPNFPYRGANTHGVDQGPGNPDQYYENEQWDDGASATEMGYLPDDKIEEPVPVRIVSATGKERRDWRATRVVVTDQAQMILGRHDKRLRTVITVHPFAADETTANTNPIYIGNDAGLRQYTGYRIGAGTTFDTLMSTEDVWAIAPVGTSVEVSVITEFGVEIR